MTTAGVAGTVDADLAERVAEACRVLGALDATHGAFGHVSVRTGPDSMLIKGKGKAEAALRHTSVEDILAVGFDVEKPAGQADLRPPSESFLHAWIYKARPDVNSVIHMHPESAVLLSVCGIPVRPIYGAYGHGGRLAVEGVPTYDSSLTVNSHERGEDFAAFFGDRRACLMRGHGVTVAGADIEEAAVMTMALKELLDITYRAHLLGAAPIVLPPDEQAEIGRPVSPDRPFGTAGGRVGTLNTWNYFRRLAGEPATRTSAGNARE
jgi:L-fuculose-phosphate aldolase